MKLTEKVDFLLEVKPMYTYRIYQNGNGEMSMEVQLTEDFKKASLRNFALVTTTKENFARCITVEYLNKLFPLLKKAISEYGTYGTIEANFVPAWE